MRMNEDIVFFGGLVLMALALLSPLMILASKDGPSDAAVQAIAATCKERGMVAKLINGNVFCEKP